jgi:hypothetical protein
VVAEEDLTWSSRGNSVGVPARPPLTFEDVYTLGCALPGVEESTSYGTPALKVGGKLLACLWEDGSTLVLKVPPVVRDFLIRTTPDAFFVTDHYRGFPIVLLRLDVAERAQLGELLEEAWRQVASKRVVDAYDARRDESPA